MAVILIVEDEVFTREVAVMMIQDWDHQTLSAGGVEEALLVLQSSQPIDALFTDIYLKKAVLGGCELAHQAIQLRHTRKISSMPRLGRCSRRNFGTREWAATQEGRGENGGSGHCCERHR